VMKTSSFYILKMLGVSLYYFCYSKGGCPISRLVFLYFFIANFLQLSQYYVTEFEDFVLNLNIMIISNFVLIYLFFYGCN